MKKLFVSICVALIGLCVSAQEKGDMAVGLNLNATPLNESGVSLTNFGFAAKYQYNFSNPFRAEAVIGYDFKAKGVSVFEVGVNANWLFSIGPKFKIYPIVGLGYANIKGYVSIDDQVKEDLKQSLGHHYDDIDDDEAFSNSTGKFFFNLGAGVEYPITDRLSACFEAKYQSMSYFNRIPLTIGIAYRF